MAHPLFGPEIKEMLDGGDAVGLAALCEELHPATIAEAVEDEFTPDQIWEIISRSEIRTQAAIFEYLPIGVQEQCLDRVEEHDLTDTARRRLDQATRVCGNGRSLAHHRNSLVAARKPHDLAGARRGQPEE